MRHCTKPILFQHLVGRAVGLCSKEYTEIHLFLLLLILYEGIRCENSHSSFGRIQHMLSPFFRIF